MGPSSVDICIPVKSLYMLRLGNRYPTPGASMDKMKNTHCVKISNSLNCNCIRNTDCFMVERYFFSGFCCAILHSSDLGRSAGRVSNSQPTPHFKEGRTPHFFLLLKPACWFCNLISWSALGGGGRGS